jgi:hypothetical protein
MLQQLFSHVFNKKILIRVAFTVLGLGGVAHAQSAGKPDATPAGTTHATPAPQGSSYNFAGGDGS